MFGTGFAHQGDKCTFEVLETAFRVTDETVHRLGEIVHDLVPRTSVIAPPRRRALRR
jgi:hypothetical protein